MARLYRMLSPGIGFTILGFAVLGAGRWNWFHVRGGLTTIGLYALGLQILLSALLIFAIDDLSSGPLWHRGGRRTGSLIDISARPVSFPRGLAEFYLQPFGPAFLLGFGLGASLSAIAAGSFQETTQPSDLMSFGLGMHRSEADLGVILLLGAIFLWWRGGRSYFGWVIGVGLATALGQVVFVAGTNVTLTFTSWSVATAGVCLLRLLAFGLARTWSHWSRGRADHMTEPEPPMASPL